MKPGSKLDQIVAEKVMGGAPKGYLITPMGTRYESVDEAMEAGCGGFAVISSENLLPPYSTSIAFAWEVVEKLCENDDLDFQYCELVYIGRGNWQFRNHTDEGICCDKEIGVIAKTAPLSICLTALKAVGYDMIVEDKE